MSTTITRRGFFGLLGGAIAHQAVKKTYFFAPPNGWQARESGLFAPGEAMFFLPAKGWKYQYVYRNPITGCVSNPTPDIETVAHTFACPEMDVLDVYKQMKDGSYGWERIA
jgi:hypothetical protein